MSDLKECQYCNNKAKINFGLSQLNDKAVYTCSNTACEINGTYFDTHEWNHMETPKQQMMNRMLRDVRGSNLNIVSGSGL